MSLLDLALIFFLLLAILNYWAQRSVLYPPFIFCTMWLLDLAVLRSGLIEVDPVHGNTLAILAAGGTAFSMGGLLAGFAPRELLRIHLFPPKPERMPHFLRNLLTVGLLCGLFILFDETLQLSRSVGSGPNILANARVAMVNAAQNGELTQQSFVLNYFTPFAILVSLLFATEKRDREYWIVTAVAFVGCVLSTGRGDLLVLISGLSGIRLIQTGQESLLKALRHLRWPIALFLTLYIGLIFSNKNTEGMNGGFTSIATYFVLSYIVGPLAAFDKVVQHPADFVTGGSHTFQFPLKLAAALHLTNYTAPPLLDAFTFVPFPTNVYTVFKFYFVEIGTVWTLVFLFVFGLFHTLLYVKAKRGGRLSAFLFAFSIYAVITVIFDDSYSTIGMYLRTILFGLLYFLIGSVPFRLLPVIRPKFQLKNPHPRSSNI